MKLFAFAIFDDKAKAYLPPFFLPTMAMGQRAFTTAVNDPTTEFGKHSADYTLFCLGEWDNLNAKFDLNEPYINVCNGMEVKDLIPPTFQRKLDAVFDAVFKNEAFKPNGSFKEGSGTEVPISSRDG